MIISWHSNQRSGWCVIFLCYPHQLTFGDKASVEVRMELYQGFVLINAVFGRYDFWPCCLWHVAFMQKISKAHLHYRPNLERCISRNMRKNLPALLLWACFGWYRYFLISFHAGLILILTNITAQGEQFDTIHASESHRLPSVVLAIRTLAVWKQDRRLMVFLTAVIVVGSVGQCVVMERFTKSLVCELAIVIFFSGSL